MVSAKMKSDQAKRKQNSPEVMRPLRLSGRMIRVNASQCVAPSTSAASTSVRGSDTMKARRIRIAKGTPIVASARISPVCVLSSPMRA